MDRSLIIDTEDFIKSKILSLINHLYSNEKSDLDSLNKYKYIMVEYTLFLEKLSSIYDFTEVNYFNREDYDKLPLISLEDALEKIKNILYFLVNDAYLLDIGGIKEMLNDAFFIADLLKMIMVAADKNNSLYSDCEFPF